MRRKAVALVALCGLFSSCSDTTAPLDLEFGSFDYSLAEVSGSSVPGLASSLPGLAIWTGSDDSTLTVARGGLSCSDSGVAEETYLFRLSKQGSDTWDPIHVSLPLTCEKIGSQTVRFRNTDTGEVIDGGLQERFDGCPVIVKDLPGLASLKRAYVAATSGAGFPADMTLPGNLNGLFLAASCMAM